MVYRREHWQISDNCNGMDCKILTAYVRIEGTWIRIGHYGSECKKFEPLDLQQEEKERLDKERMMQLVADFRQVKQENRARLNTIKNELNVSNSFFK
ncbi:MAG: hypothetical protein EPO37_09000 [Nitrosarchaeum sp.]|nr:MAG: hypothetical protein EPO37_09000 [Nitrosarchaeum sp.]